MSLIIPIRCSNSYSKVPELQITVFCTNELQRSRDKYGDQKYILVLTIYLKVAEDRKGFLNNEKKHAADIKGPYALLI